MLTCPGLRGGQPPEKTQVLRKLNGRSIRPTTLLSVIAAWVGIGWPMEQFRFIFGKKVGTGAIETDELHQARYKQMS